MTKTRVSPTLVAWIAVTVAVGVVAYLIGSQRQSSPIAIVGPGIGLAAQGNGTAYIGAHEPLNKQPVGPAYSLPEYIPWSDSSGEMHEGSHAPCLSPAKAVYLKNIEAVQFTIPHGVTEGTVVWVQC